MPAKLPQPPTDHPSLLLTAAYQLAIKENNIVELTTIYLLMRRTVITHFDFQFYDCSKLCAIHQTAMNILNSTISLAVRNAAAFNTQPIGYFACTNMYTLISKIDHYYT